MNGKMSSGIYTGTQDESKSCARVVVSFGKETCRRVVDYGTQFDIEALSVFLLASMILPRNTLVKEFFTFFEHAV